MTEQEQENTKLKKFDDVKLTKFDDVTLTKFDVNLKKFKPEQKDE